MRVVGIKGKPCDVKRMESPIDFFLGLTAVPTAKDSLVSIVAAEERFIRSLSHSDNGFSHDPLAHSCPGSSTVDRFENTPGIAKRPTVDRLFLGSWFNDDVPDIFTSRLAALLF